MHVSIPSQSPLILSFWDGGQREGHGCVKRLKPDGIGIICELPTGTEDSELSWEDIEFIFESKRMVKQIVKQSGMYTRLCLLNNPRRFFYLGLGLHFTTLEFIFSFVFHRSGVSSSRPLKLTTEEGFRSLVRHAVGILSFKGEAAYGLDTIRTQNMYTWILRAMHGVNARADAREVCCLLNSLIRSVQPQNPLDGLLGDSSP